jgi:hypothetical protein
MYGTWLIKNVEIISTLALVLIQANHNLQLNETGFERIKKIKK